MSASLVGSEMCIRDRTRAQRARLGPGPRAPNPSEQSARQMDYAMHEPVSYTHLTLPTICSV
eukprot:5192128-Alexandrium_andersonii.AAC.1